jgi:hypothetical protein
VIGLVRLDIFGAFGHRLRTLVRGIRPLDTAAAQQVQEVLS